MHSRIMKVGCLTLLTALAIVAVPSADDQPRGSFEHVLLISIDGLHAQDLDWYLQSPPDGSALAWLSANGRTYTNASATKPSDSFPGMLAMVTGGTPRSTGVYYDDGWDRSLAASSGTCPPATPGTRVRWKQNLDVTYPSFATFADYKTFWQAGPPASAAPEWPLDSAKLPRDPAQGCSRVFPHMFPRVNNVFEVIKGAGGRTAWSDKHPAYEFLMGISGTGVDDLYSPEIATPIGSAPSPTSPLTAVITDDFQRVMDYDDLKVAAVLNQINGFDHGNNTAVGVPTLFGMNFQAVSVGQKLDMSTGAPPIPGGEKGGYLDANGTPSAPLQRALRHTDDSIGRMIATLTGQGLLDSTLIIVSAKHGNSPIDPNALHRVDPALINATVNSVAPGLAAQVSADTGPLIWLKDQSKTAAVVAALDANRLALSIAGGPGEGILSGDAIKQMFADPASDVRVPDIILLPVPGTVYVAPANIVINGVPTPFYSKIADHGSFYENDVHVALIVANSRLPQMTIDDPVETRQIACTILRALGEDCGALQSEAIEPSMSLPPAGWAFGHK
jgi:predicted AlkP superfamily pyrophosphatase or phosphodiesterase